MLAHAPDCSQFSAVACFEHPTVIEHLSIPRISNSSQRRLAWLNSPVVPGPSRNLCSLGQSDSGGTRNTGAKFERTQDALRQLLKMSGLGSELHVRFFCCCCCGRGQAQLVHAHRLAAQRAYAADFRLFLGRLARSHKNLGGLSRAGRDARSPFSSMWQRRLL